MRDKRLWAVVFAAAVRMGAQGFGYYPQLDDYIQYGIYPFYARPFAQAFLHIGLYAARPLAALADICLWGRLWGHMGIALFVITLLHAVSAYLFILTAERLGMRLGMLFAAVYLLCPMNIEGSYWISASSRVVVGLFLCRYQALCSCAADRRFFAFSGFVPCFFMSRRRCCGWRFPSSFFAA